MPFDLNSSWFMSLIRNAKTSFINAAQYVINLLVVL